MDKERITAETTTERKTWLGMDGMQLREAGGTFTAKEIAQQPRLWKSTWALVNENKSALQAFLGTIFASEDMEVILTGAGTSAYIGSILRDPFQKGSHKHTWAVPTTDLVSHPHHYFQSDRSLLLVSFARSGNSPESVAAINLANALCKKAFHLIITCNTEGDLARMGDRPDCFVFHLPAETNDRGLAMTSSFTCMLLAGLLITRIDRIHRYEETVSRLADYGNRIISQYTQPLKDMASLDFNRAVFLGSGPLQSAAQESQLKLQELTDGKVICKHDSFLGLRHGPKVVIDPKTLIFFLYSNDDYVHLYEADLVKSILATEKGIGQIGISESPDNDLQATLGIYFSGYGEKIEEDFLSVCSVLPAQILAFFKSVNLGLKPDAPSANDTITRVVQGVTIYPYRADHIHAFNRL
ncbi:tagatose-6-phosphate ketose [Parapedobacter pyrenivorans]|uniref:Tagatose-6-phosphate ketose n=1 Tax=Parapedobacter pyrenivorans TaxID=1305674 RepID=A0A917M5U8_9SPHI|nr:SIS domain-containing protein [Parapedobacter pyrenivorans]GGG79842.1 tagatose-6-phosphate ketose [Parapedobacter pyrenivorans]